MGIVLGAWATLLDSLGAPLDPQVALVCESPRPKVPALWYSSSIGNITSCEDSRISNSANPVRFFSRTVDVIM